MLLAATTLSGFDGIVSLATAETWPPLGTKRPSWDANSSSAELEAKMGSSIVLLNSGAHAWIAKFAPPCESCTETRAVLGLPNSGAGQRKREHVKLLEADAQFAAIIPRALAGAPIFLNGQPATLEIHYPTDGLPFELAVTVAGQTFAPTEVSAALGYLQSPSAITPGDFVPLQAELWVAQAPLAAEPLPASVKLPPAAAATCRTGEGLSLASRT
jgi:hypothetical protein